MRQVTSTNTTPEIELRKALWKRGLRYRRRSGKLPGKPDLVFPGKRLALFVDGDYWHGGQWSRRNLTRLEDQFANSESAKKDYWIRKIYGNMNRDLVNTAKLLSDGWKVLRFWESDIKRDLDSCADMVVHAIGDSPAPSLFSVMPFRSVAEFFAGAGLMRMALENQGWKVSFANDIDRKKHEMYKAQFPGIDLDYQLDDIHKISAEQVPRVGLATASFPCNDLSLAGARKGLRQGQSSAFWGFLRIMKEMGDRRPPLALLENVPGFLTSKGGADFHAAMKGLNRLGYRVDPFFLDASRFVPQSRLRLFVVAILDDISHIPGFTGLDHLDEDELRPKALIKFIKDHKDINWAIRKLPAPPVKNSSLEAALEDLPETAPQWWRRKRAEYLLSQMSPRHRGIAESMIMDSHWSYGTIFRRVRNGKTMAELRTDGVAGCLRTPRGGSGRQILFKAGFGKYMVRLLTPRECARLMGADDYKIEVPDNQAFFGFGDAVCVPVIEWIAAYYLNPIACELIRGGIMYC